jgi:hypothetical protein
MHGGWRRPKETVDSTFNKERENLILAKATVTYVYTKIKYKL